MRLQPKVSVRGMKKVLNPYRKVPPLRMAETVPETTIHQPKRTFLLVATAAKVIVMALTAPSTLSLAEAGVDEVW